MKTENQLYNQTHLATFKNIFPVEIVTKNHYQKRAFNYVKYIWDYSNEYMLYMIAANNGIKTPDPSLSIPLGTSLAVIAQARYYYGILRFIIGGWDYIVEFSHSTRPDTFVFDMPIHFFEALLKEDFNEVLMEITSCEPKVGRSTTQARKDLTFWNKFYRDGLPDKDKNDVLDYLARAEASLKDRAMLAVHPHRRKKILKDDWQIFLDGVKRYLLFINNRKIGVHTVYWEYGIPIIPKSGKIWNVPSV